MLEQKGRGKGVMSGSSMSGTESGRAADTGQDLGPDLQFGSI